MANLTQLRMLEGLSGVLLVDKPAGIAFASVVKAVKHRFNLVKVGHGGSLDPAASGLLVLLVNDANRFVGDVMGADRSYEGMMRLGLSTNTYDIHGEKTGESGRDGLPDDFGERAAKALPEFKGDVFQTESRWCSVRREGSAEYELADTGEHSPFLVHVYRLEVGQPERLVPDCPGFARLPFSVVGTKGLIVRSLVHDFGEALGCGACLESLRRLKVGRFDVAVAVPFDKVLDTDIADFASLVVPLSRAFA